jgi:hypothetical protein
MRVPDPKPAPLTWRARVLREVAALEKMMGHVRAKLAPMGKSGPKMKGDQGLCEAIEGAIRLGRAIAADLDVAVGPSERRSRDVTAFMDLVFAVKLDFFQHAGESGDGFPI